MYLMIRSSAPAARRCHWAGCTERALPGAPLCEAHEREERQALRDALEKLRQRYPGLQKKDLER
jgi:hypothetical protein